MSKKNWILVAVLGVVVIFCAFVGLTYNGLVTKEFKVDEAWGNVEVQYQRRANLIPNLVETVKGYASHEQITHLETVRARANSTHIDPSTATPEQIKAWQKAQDDVKNAINVVVEAYPDLKAQKSFEMFQVQLESTENRISKAHKDYNATAKEYNVATHRFPSNIIANIFGFEPKRDMFTAEAGTEVVPKVDFGTAAN